MFRHGRILRMPVVIALLRGVNVGGHCKLPMATLRAICEQLGHEGAVTYIQSGNAVFRTKRDLGSVAGELEAAIEAKVGFRPAVALRTMDQMQAVIAANPFAGRASIDPARLLVTFLVKDPGEAARERARAIDVAPEELHAIGSEMFIYFANGLGRTKLPWKALERSIDCPGTGRNWNTVLKLLEIARGFKTESVSRGV